ncbi:MAG: leucine-rich repeat protein [Clostridia bacterium]|nr:leucine-rich repeat protein [Clostridia bacterium]
MKKNVLTVLFGILLLFSLSFSSCNANQKMFGDTTETDTSTALYATMIKDLENQIAQLKQNQYISDAENQEELNRLQNLLAELKGEASEQLPSTESESEDTNGSDTETPQTIPKFLYTQNGSNATITGYTGSDEILVIPSKIDGFTVTAISDSAFQSNNLKTVVVADGITKIGWFAFRDCPSLSSVTIPSTVSSIGYSAFSSESNQLTIYCHSNSFAQKYAQSYGISHAII